MSERVKEPMLLEVPEGLESQFEAAVVAYAESMGEKPSDIRRAVEIAVIQAGLRHIAASTARYQRLSDEIENRGFAERMGWPRDKEEES